jgi:hypothetical protein
MSGLRTESSGGLPRKLTRRLWHMRGRYWVVRQAKCWSANRCAPPRIVSGTPADRTHDDVFETGRSELTFAVGLGIMLFLLALVVNGVLRLASAAK